MLRILTPNTEALVDANLAAYCDPDAARRNAAIARIWHPEGRLVDPPMEALGHKGISAQADKLLAKFPGHRFRRTTAVDLHHEFVRYGWVLEAPDGKPAITGTDFVHLDVDGRLMVVVGFFGELAQRPSV